MMDRCGQRSLLRNISFGLLSLIVLVLVGATFVEKYMGAGFVLATVYHSPWFVALWALSALSGLCYILQQHRAFPFLISEIS